MSLCTTQDGADAKIGIMARCADVEIGIVASCADTKIGIVTRIGMISGKVQQELTQVESMSCQIARLSPK